MADNFFPDETGVITATEEDDVITWVNTWLQDITVYASLGNDVIDFKLSEYKNKLNGQDGDDTIYGGTNNDNINGGNGFDLIYGYNGNDKLYGLAGDDTLYGGEGNDYISSGTGNDKIYGQNGNDSLYGGDGNDYISAGAGSDTINGQNGNDSLYGGDGNDYISGGNNNDKIYGQNGNDSLYGGSGSDYISAGAGNDKLYGQDGNDSLYGGSGSDYISAGAGSDKLYGQDGNDSLYGGDGSDYISGGNNNDNIYGQNGNDSLYGGSGNDKISGGNNNDIINGQDGNDLLYAGSGNDTINGGTGSDTIYCQQGNNSVSASTGNDIIYAGSGNDTINGGSGTNSIIFTLKTGNAVIKNGGGTDNLKFHEKSDIQYKFNDNDLVITYGSNGKTVTVKDYTRTKSHFNIYEGDTKIKINAPLPVTRTYLSIGEEITVSLTTKEAVKIVLQNGFLNNKYTYTVNAISGNQVATFKYLQNGRLIIKSNYANITAGTNQSDDLILLGNNNKVNTGNKNDIVRVGYVIDAAGEYIDSSNSNTINTGDGDDYVTLYGYSNTVNGGSGDDKVCYSGISGTFKSDINNCEEERGEFANSDSRPDGDIDWFTQGTGGGDCRLLALIHSLSQKHSIDDYVSITNRADGYNVTFLNYVNSNRSVTISENELDYFTNSYGDLDTVLIDYALNKLLSINMDYGEYTVADAYYNSFSEYFFGKTDTTYIAVTESNISKIGELWNLYKNGTIENFTLGISGYSEDLPQSIVGGHAYSIKNYTDKYIQLVNVWDSADILNLDINTLKSLRTYAVVYGYGSTTLVPQGSSGASIKDTNISELQNEIACWTNTDFGIDSDVIDTFTTNKDIISCCTSDFVSDDLLINIK